MQGSTGHPERDNRTNAESETSQVGNRNCRHNNQELVSRSDSPDADDRGGSENSTQVCPAGYTDSDEHQQVTSVEKSRRGVTLSNPIWQWLEEMKVTHSMRTISVFLEKLLNKIIEENPDE